MGKVVVLGSLHMDVMVYAPDRPRKGETLRGSGWGLRCGGKGGNQAVQAAIHGAEVAMISRVGDDDFGQQLLANLRAHGVNTEAVLLDAEARQRYERRHRRRNRGLQRGHRVRREHAHGCRSISTARICRQFIQAADVLVLQYEVPLETVALAAQAAASAGTTVVLNAAPAYPPPPGLLLYVDILVVNEVEGEMLSGRTITDRESALAIAAQLAQQVRAVILTLGGAGAIVAAAGTVYHLPAYKVDVVDTHGAGDAFVGALALPVELGCIALDRAVRYASAAGALMCAKVEASPERMRALLTGTSLA